MKMYDLKNQDKPRERLMSLGVRSLSDVELLAILIGSGTKEQNVFQIAVDVLKQYSLKELKELSYDKITKIHGIKAAKASVILAAFELARRSMQNENPKPSFKYAKDIYQHIYEDIMLEEKEVIIVLYVDCKLRLLKKYVNSGSYTHQIEIPLKEIIRNALEYHAYGVILIHNHPSGELEPSEADIEATFEIKELLLRLEILLLDHLVVTKTSFYSMAEHNIICLD